MISPVTSSGEECRDRLRRDHAPAPKHGDPVGDRKHVGHAVADQDDADAVIAQPPDQVQHLRHLAHGDRGGRLVHQHDLRIGKPRSGDRDRLPLPARHLLDQIARPRLRLQLLEELASAPVHASNSRGCGPGRSACAARAQERRWRRRSDCRKARDPDRRSRSPSGAPRSAGGNCTCSPSTVIVPCEGRKLPAMILTRVDLPAPLSPISPSTCPCSSSSDTSCSAWMAPKFLEIDANWRTATRQTSHGRLRANGFVDGIS